MSELQRALDEWNVHAMNCIRAAAVLIEGEDLEAAIKEYERKGGRTAYCRSQSEFVTQALLYWADMQFTTTYGRIQQALVEATDDMPSLDAANIHGISWHEFAIDVGGAVDHIARSIHDGPSIEDIRQDWRGLAYYRTKLAREALKAWAILRRDDTPRDPRAERDNWLYELKRDHGDRLTPEKAFGMQTSDYGFADAWKPLKASTIAKLWQGDPRLPKGKPGCPKQAKS